MPLNYQHSDVDVLPFSEYAITIYSLLILFTSVLGGIFQVLMAVIRGPEIHRVCGDASVEQLPEKMLCVFLCHMVASKKKISRHKICN